MQPNRSIRALVFDLDGTLLNSQKKVKERTQQALIQCAEMGLHLFIATARPPRSVKALIPFNILRLMSAVYYNGAYGRDFNGETFSRTIPAALSAKIIDTICRLGKRNTLSIESEDTLYALTNEIYEQNRKHMFVPPTLVSPQRMISIPASELLGT